MRSVFSLSSLFVLSLLVNESSSSKVQDDTVSFTNLSADCVLGNHKLRCTAWGYRTHLQTTVRLISDSLVSCISHEERADRCWWGVYASGHLCCNEEQALKVQQQGKDGFTCSCAGDLPLTHWDEAATNRVIIQAHSPQSNLCLSIKNADSHFEECNKYVLKSPLWQLIHPEEVVDGVTVNTPNNLYHLVWSEGKTSYYEEPKKSGKDETTTTTTAAASLGMGSLQQQKKGETKGPTSFNCLKAYGTDIQLGVCASDKGYNDESLLFEVVELTSDKTKATGFVQFRASAGNKCISSLTQQKIGLRDCNVNDETQWFLLYDVDNNEASPAMDQLLAAIPDTKVTSNAVSDGLLFGALVSVTALLSRV